MSILGFLMVISLLSKLRGYRHYEKSMNICVNMVQWFKATIYISMGFIVVS